MFDVVSSITLLSSLNILEEKKKRRGNSKPLNMKDNYIITFCILMFCTIYIYIAL